jgi:excisionase family DNA binding protein
MAPGDLLNVNEAAAMLHLRPSTIRSWILDRRIPHVKLGSHVFLKRSDLEALIDQSVIPATEKGKARVVIQTAPARDENIGNGVSKHEQHASR